MTDIEKLDALAESATPGRREWGEAGHALWADDVQLLDTCSDDRSPSKADRDFIAAADPPTIRALIKALREAVKGLALDNTAEKRCNRQSQIIAILKGGS